MDTHETLYLKGFWRAPHDLMVRLAYALCCLLALLISLLSSPSPQETAFVFLALQSLPFAMLAVGHYNLKATYLILNDDGIVFHEPGVTRRARWEEVQEVGLVVFGSRCVEGLYLKQPELGGLERLERRLRGRYECRTLPLAPFEEGWREGRIGRILREKVPEVLQGTP